MDDAVDNEVARKRVPKTIALIRADSCTGCDACRAVCPVDCIHGVSLGLSIKGTHAWCEVDMERCIGCALCVRIPQRSSNPFELKVCPWDAIDMVDSQYLAQAVAGIGGPPEYVQQHGERLRTVAERVSQERTRQLAAKRGAG